MDRWTSGDKRAVRVNEDPGIFIRLDEFIKEDIIDNRILYIITQLFQIRAPVLNSWLAITVILCILYGMRFLNSTPTWVLPSCER